MNYDFGEQTKLTQDAALEILRDVVDVLNKNDLKYVAYFGTLLGAIRHKGYIPWDDDIDLLMPREDYEKLKMIFNEKFDDKYFLQDIYTDKEYPSLIAKVRNSSTTFIERGYIKCRRMNQGIFIDIFVADNFVDNRINKFRAKKLKVLESLLVSKTSIFSPKYKRFFAKFFRRKLLINSIEKTIKRFSIGKGECKYIAQSRFFIDKNIFSDTIVVPFENITIAVPRNYDKYLTDRYGDWRKLPKEEDRVPKHSTKHVRIDISYKDYIDNVLEKKSCGEM